jgi:hypothetical protein
VETSTSISEEISSEEEEEHPVTPIPEESEEESEETVPVPEEEEESEPTPIIPEEEESEESVPAPPVDDESEELSEETIVEEEHTRYCMEGEGSMTPVGFDATQPIAEQELNGNFKSYGFGFWMRWTQRYPSALHHGATDDKYFIARLTENNPYSDVDIGDRALALFLGKDGLEFSTYDTVTNNGNVGIHFPVEDIEGKWVYVYYSYSGINEKASAIVHWADSEPTIQEV